MRTIKAVMMPHILKKKKKKMLLLFRRQSFPGKSVTVNVKSKPNTFVGLMAVDARVNSLKLGHDFTMEEVVDEIRGYDSARDPSFIPWFKVSKLHILSIEISVISLQYLLAYFTLKWLH